MNKDAAIFMWTKQRLNLFYKTIDYGGLLRIPLIPQVSQNSADKLPEV